MFGRVSRVERARYRVVLLDNQGFEVGEKEADTLKEAKGKARYMLSDEYARNTESTHDRTHKVEVRNADGECVFDAFR